MRRRGCPPQDPHGIPSGGDWTLERSAALFIDSAERVTVTGCVFERIDGNSIMVSGYARNTTITYNEFYMLGGTAIAQWGNTYGGDDRLPPGYGQDGSSGDQPRNSYIALNWASHIGVWEKQSSFYFQAKSGVNTLDGVRPCACALTHRRLMRPPEVTGHAASHCAPHCRMWCMWTHELPSTSTMAS